MEPKPLEIGASVEIEVDPAALFVSTGVLACPGERYRIEAEGLWRDGALPPCDADGWRRWYATPFRVFNRVRGEDYFVLCAAFGRDLRHAKAIGRRGEWTLPRWSSAVSDAIDAPESAEIFLFANDWPSRYRNNRRVAACEGGPMRARVSRVS